MSYLNTMLSHKLNLDTLKVLSQLPCPKVLVLYTGGTIGMMIKDEVYIPEPHYLEKALRRLVIMNDPEQSNKMKRYDTESQFLYLPVPNQTPVAYFIIEYEPLLDSSCMTIEDYFVIANDVAAEYDSFDGFVILHGTDTMAYTSSYLSFMLKNLGKPVVLTGSQIPIFETHSDGRDNLIGALMIAGLYRIPEVMVYFNNRLLRGNRVSKVDCEGLHAFDSPNFPPLATFDYKVKVDWDIILKHDENAKLSLFTDMNVNTGMLRLFPGLQPHMIKSFCKRPIEGIVLQTYGMGNVPSTNEKFIKALEEIAESVLILNCTQCPKGSVSSIYEAGAVLGRIGVISGADMTVECALAKLSYVLGHKDWSVAKQRTVLATPIRGEMTVSQSLRSQALARGPPVQDVNMVLLNAILEQSAEKVLSACENGADVNLVDKNGFTPLLFAILTKNCDVTKTLVAAGAKTNNIQKEIGNYICRAAAANDVDSLKCWKLAGSKLAQTDYMGNSPLQCALMTQSYDAFTYLINNGATDYKHKNLFGMNVLSMLKLLDKEKRKLFAKCLQRTNGSL